jgi:hypothetical protein
MSYTSDDVGTALVGVTDAKYGMEDKQNKEKQKPNVGYRLGKRKQLYEKRRKISDYCVAHFRGCGQRLHRLRFLELPKRPDGTVNTHVVRSNT